MKLKLRTRLRLQQSSIKNDVQNDCKENSEANSNKYKTNLNSCTRLDEIFMEADR